MSKLVRKTKPHRNKRQFNPFTELEYIAFLQKKYDRSPPLPSYTPKLDKLLADVVDAFSVVPEPTAESFDYAPIDAHGHFIKPPPSIAMSRMIIIKGNKGASIGASSIEDACRIMFYVKPDASLWLVPKMLIATQQWWSEIQRVAPEKEKEMQSSLLDYAYWKKKAIGRFRFIFGSITSRFCDARYSARPARETPEVLYRRQCLKEYAKDYAPLMTPQMRKSLRAYIMEWYRVMSKKYVVASFNANFEPRQSIHDCWL